MLLKDIERALDNSDMELWAQMGNGRWWKLRRNGKTQTWKRSPERFRIPVKAGLKSCGEVQEDSNVAEYYAGMVLSPYSFVAAPYRIDLNKLG